MNLMDESECAAYLGVKPRTLRLWRRTRGLPHIKLTHKIIRYRKEDVDQWLNQNRIN